MEKEVKKDIISVLTQSVFLIKKRDFIALKELSNHVIHNASIYQDKYSLQTAVTIYALSKILERAEQKKQDVPEKVVQAINHLIECATNGDDSNFDNCIKNLFTEIGKIDEKFPWHIQTVIEKANVVKGGNLYRHGISLGRVAEILGITQWELMSYVGKTTIADKEKEITDYKSRLALTRRLFNV